MTETEPKQKQNRREFLGAAKNLFLFSITFGLGLHGGKNITIGELQKQTDLQVEEANKSLSEARQTLLNVRKYTTGLEKYTEDLEILFPDVLIRASLPGKKPFFFLGLYDTSTYKVRDDKELVDLITRLAALKAPPPSFKGQRIELTIQDIKVAMTDNKPKKPSSVLEPPKPDFAPDLRRIN